MLQNHHGGNTGFRARFGQVFCQEKQQVGLLKYIHHVSFYFSQYMKDFHIYFFAYFALIVITEKLHQSVEMLLFV